MVSVGQSRGSPSLGQERDATWCAQRRSDQGQGQYSVSYKNPGVCNALNWTKPKTLMQAHLVWLLACSPFEALAHGLCDLLHSPLELPLVFRRCERTTAGPHKGRGCSVRARRQGQPCRPSGVGGRRSRVCCEYKTLHSHEIPRGRLYRAGCAGTGEVRK